LQTSIEKPNGRARLIIFEMIISAEVKKLWAKKIYTNDRHLILNQSQSANPVATQHMVSYEALQGLFDTPL
jgi:hypothetical protein